MGKRIHHKNSDTKPQSVCTINLADRRFQEYELVDLDTVPWLENVDCDQCTESIGGTVVCDPVWRIDPEHGRGGITCMNCAVAYQECSFWSTDFDVKVWPTVVESAVSRALDQNPTRPNRANNRGEGSSTGGTVRNREVRIALAHLNTYEARLQDPTQTVLSLLFQRVELLEIQRQEEHEAAALRSLVDDRRPLIESLIQMFDQAIHSRGQEDLGDQLNAEDEQ